MQIILQLGSIVVPFAIGITINHANSMPFFSIVLAMADLHHRPHSTLHAASKTSQTLDFIDYRGVCPRVLGERGMGNVTAPCGGLRPMGKQTRRAKRVPRERAEKIFSSATIYRPARPSPPPRAAGRPGKRGYISLRLRYLSMFLLNMRGPPKNAYSESVICSPFKSLCSISATVQSKSATWNSL